MSRVAAVAAIFVVGLMGAYAAPSAGMSPMDDPRPTKAPPGALVRLTAEQDRQRLLDLLHIKSMRPVPGAKARSADIALPDPLRTVSGKAVLTTDIWWQERRQEIIDAFENVVFGHVPDDALRLDFKPLSSVREKVGNVAAVTRVLVASLGSPTRPPIAVNAKLSVSLPATAHGPVPVVLLMSTGQASSSWRAQVLARGWGAAVLDLASLQADSGAGLTEGVIGIFNNGHPRRANQWGVLRAWAWGASRAMDYFENDPSIDSAHVAIAGHARAGKAALLAMAVDARFVVAFVSSSGAGGAKLLRRPQGETIEMLTGPPEYHLFAGQFLEFGGPKSAADLPVDAHELLALCAPRPVFITAAAQGDEASDPAGMFLTEVAAEPVYRLMGKKGLGTAKMPPVGKLLASGALAFHQHAGAPGMDPDWPAFLKYAQPYLQPPRTKR